MLHADLIAPIADLLRRHGIARGDKIAYRDAHRAVTYGALLARTGRLAGHLADAGIAPGETVALMLPNSVPWVESLLAIARAGTVSVPVRYDPPIIRGGQNIAPAEIEEVVNTFAAVLDCAVVGVPHEHLGEVPALFVVPRAGQTIAVEALLGHCREKMSAYQVPHIVQLIAEIPRTGSGKIIRYKLCETLKG
jgi:acyl-CoA synthetase (AMP-forming)/AMP-acid ligase II